MGYSLPVKFIAILLSAIALVACVGSIIGIVQLVNYNLYNNSVDEWLQNGLTTKIAALAALIGMLAGCGGKAPQETTVPEETQVQIQTEPQTQETIVTTAPASEDVLEILVKR